MPQVIAGPIALAAFNAGAPLGVANAIIGVGVAGAIVHGVVSTALIVGASYAVSRLTAPAQPKPSDGQIEFRQPLPVRFFPYGACKLSGPVLLLETQEHDLNKITAFSTRELGSIEKFYVDGNEVTLDGDGSLTNYWNAGSFVHTFLGTDDQAADNGALLYFSLGWTSAHRLRGIAYAYARLDSDDPQDFQGSFPNGEPQFSIVSSGVKLYDPRKDTTNGGSGSHRMEDPSTWEASDNQRLCALDWLTWPDGYNKGWERIDWATWVPQIEMADEAVPLKAGGTEPRYRAATIVRYDEPRKQVLRRLLDAGGQQLFTTRDGLIGSRGGTWEEPTVTLDAAAGEILEASFTAGVPLMDRINEFEVSAMLPSHDYSEVELKPVVNFLDADHANGIVRRQTLDLTQVPSNGQAQRLAKNAMRKRNAPLSGQIRTNLAGIRAIGESVINLKFDELGIDGPFYVDGRIAFLPDKTGVTLPVVQADETAWDWDAEDEEQDAPPIAGEIDEGEGEGTAVVQDEDGSVMTDEDNDIVFDEAA